jgi:RimJ/RimL family protein N-acetyltransferase
MSPEIPAWRRGLPTLTAAIVSTREVVTSDATALYELLTDTRVTAHISPPPPSIEAFEGFIAWAQRERTMGHAVCFGIVPAGLQQAVGIIQVRAQEPTFVTAEWGFALGAAFWSTGVFEDAARLVAQFAFDTLQVYRLESRAVVQNGRGNGALHKLGAKPEATLASAFKRGQGDYGEQLLWSLIADEWHDRPTPHTRFSGDAARFGIARAVLQVQDQLRASAPRVLAAPPTLYPFFVTDTSAFAVCPSCGARRAEGGCSVCRR